MFSLLEALRETCFRKPEVNICVLGLDGAGKTTVLERAKGLFGSRLPAMPPDKIQPTVGMNLAKLDVSGCRVTFWDLGGAARVRSLWPRYYADAHGWVYVVDAADADRLREARDAFDQACDHPDLRDAPCVVLANKQDAASACGADELATLLEVRLKNDARRVVDLRPASARDAPKLQAASVKRVPSTRDQSHARGSYAQRRQEQEAEPWLKLEVRQKDEEPSRAKRAKLEPAGS